MDESHLRSIDSCIVDPTSSDQTLAELGQVPAAQKLASWLEALMRIQISAVSTSEFFEATVQAIVNVIGLDHGIVVLQDSDQWNVESSFSRDPDQPAQFSQTVLERVVRDRKTYYESFSNPSAIESLANVQAYVASPILNAKHEVVGVLFGSKLVSPLAADQGITELEAQIVQLLAGAVSAGLEREERQSEAGRNRVQLEQFTSPKLVKAMRMDPTILDAREKVVTLLFTDIRGFTGLSERLGPVKTYELIRNVMDKLTGCILDQDGFIIDYAGDGIAAMWNAPTDQTDHAELACYAAIQMQRAMHKLGQFWKFISGEHIAVGIGINTGIAQVGNAGSRWRLKYSPLGHNVNLASRIEGATKFFEAPILIAESTSKLIGDEYTTRRIGPVSVAGIEMPVQLLQLMDTEPDDDLVAKNQEYEQALSLFERQQPAEATQRLNQILERWPADRLSSILLAQLAADQPVSTIQLPFK